MSVVRKGRECRARRLAAMVVWFCASPVFAGEVSAVCGAPGNAGGDMSLEHVAQQPASMLTCAAGYLLEKCGDHATANLVFDKCIAAGYAGAMIWKGLLYENGNGVPRDDTKAAELFKRAATSGSDGYATLGKVHYASALYQGRGVPRDEAEALKWFRAAAAEGSKDAEEFLHTGHHTASRDRSGAGVGTPREKIEGQRLEKIAAAPAHPVSTGMWLLLAVVFALGLVRQARGRQPRVDAQGVHP